MGTPARTRAAVLCVGNLTVGGTGKTPLAIALARRFLEKSVATAFLARGYGRESSGALLVDPRTHDARIVGDEAMLLAGVAPTVVAIDRLKGARLAEAHGARAIVMDDGHQNFRLAKDLTLIAVDGESGFGNGKVVPAGPLREPLRQGLVRADAVVIVGEGEPPIRGFAGAVLRANLVAERRFDGQRLFAFAGIGRPAKFFGLLRRLGAELVGSESFADHHRYSPADLAALRHAAKQTGANLITTEKDIVRLSAAQREGIDVLPVRAVFEDESELERLLSPLIARARSAP